MSDLDIMGTDSPECAQGGRYSVQDVVATWAGVSVRTIFAILSQSRDTVRFDTVDKLLCALDVPQLWFCEPLSEHYPWSF